MIDVLVQAMAVREGEYARVVVADLPQKNNNPINLKFGEQEGAWCSICGAQKVSAPCASSSGKHGFAKFGAAGVGWAAAYRQVAKWIQTGKSLDQLITTQAPPSENDTAGYIAFVAAKVKAVVPAFDQTKPLHLYMP